MYLCCERKCLLCRWLLQGPAFPFRICWVLFSFMFSPPQSKLSELEIHVSLSQVSPLPKESGVRYLCSLLGCKCVCVCVCVCVSRSIVSNSLGPFGLSPTRLLCPWILQERILEWVAIPFSRGLSQPRDRTQVSRIAGRFFTTEPPGKPLSFYRWY